MFHVLILNAHPESSQNILFEGQSASVVLPGDEGQFEILDFHKPILSRLKKGFILVDNQKAFRIKSGVAKMDHQRLIAMVDA